MVHAGLDISLPQLLQDLTAVQDVLLEYPPPSTTGALPTLTNRTRHQQQILDPLNIPEPMAKPII